MPGADDDLERVVRRLRGFSPRAWAGGGRRDAVRRLAAELVTLGQTLGEAGHELPDVPDYAYADVIAVVGREAIENGRRDEVAAAVRRALAETR